MPIRVYNTLSRQKEEFQTVVPGKVGMYLCGPTVYKPAHIGHMVGPVIFDTIKKYLAYSGYQVRFVINITDVDDKLIVRAFERGTTVDELARAMTEDYFDNLKLMGVDSVDLFPRATEHIPEMQSIIQTLIDKGFAYPLEGDVYFDVSKDANYGALSRRSISDMLAGTRVEANERKRHPADFALWKRSKPGEPRWESPWGPGRPGWHIECSAMSMKYLGQTFDIHGGGLDLMFPHHENELAQSECCTGLKFARYWLHNGLMQSGKASGKVGGAHDRTGDAPVDAQAQEAGKLAGSKGAASVKLLFDRFAPETIRFFVLSTHYRSPIDFSEEHIADAARALEGFYRLFESFERVTGGSFYALKAPARRDDSTPLPDHAGPLTQELRALRDRFLEAMDDDFNTGAAVGALFELRRVINQFVQEQKLESTGKANAQARDALLAAATLLKELSALLGLFRQAPAARGAADDQFASGLMALVLELRADARAAKNWSVSDKIRDRLKALRVVVEDRPEGVTWRKE